MRVYHVTLEFSTEEYVVAESEEKARKALEEIAVEGVIQEGFFVIVRLATPDEPSFAEALLLVNLEAEDLDV